MTNKIPVCLCCDLNYLRYACVTMASVAYTSSAPVDFYILHTSISKEQQNIVKNWMNEKFNQSSITFIDITKQLSEINIKQVRHFNALVFGRYFIPQLLPNIKKAIYLDSDTIVLRDIAALAKADLDGMALGAVYEYWQDNSIYGSKVKQNLEYLHLSKTHKYFSSGVLLIDCEKWRKQSVLNALLEEYKKYRDITQYPDQDPLNKLFENKYQHLDAKFNATEQAFISLQQDNAENNLLALKNDIVVRHFAGDNKPWNKVDIYEDVHGKKCSDNFNDWWFFAQMTPFIAAIENNFLEKQMIDFRNIQDQQNSSSGNAAIAKHNKKTVCKLFGKIPVWTIKHKKNKKVYRLFGFMPVATIKQKKNRTVYRLFGVIPLISIHRK